MNSDIAASVIKIILALAAVVAAESRYATKEYVEKSTPYIADRKYIVNRLDTLDIRTREIRADVKTLLKESR